MSREHASGYMRHPCKGHGVACFWLLPKPKTDLDNTTLVHKAAGTPSGRPGHSTKEHTEKPTQSRPGTPPVGPAPNGLQITWKALKKQSNINAGCRPYFGIKTTGHYGPVWHVSPEMAHFSAKWKDVLHLATVLNFLT